MPKETITHLVFQGCSVRGAAYLSSAQGLEAAGIPLQQIKQVAGTSAGSIAALLIALGCSVDREAAKISVTRISLIKIWVAEHLSYHQ